MQYIAFPAPVRLMTQVPRLMGMRLDQFVNVDGEPFNTPTLNGFWRIEMQVVARTEQAKLAISAFVTAMEAGAACVVPICSFRPNSETGRPLASSAVAPSFTFEHSGFAGDPFEGFRLFAPASHRDSFVDISKPALSQLAPGHFFSLGDRLHQVIGVSHIDEHPDRIRVSVMPNIRGGHAAGALVVVDQVRLRCVMDNGEQIGHLGAGSRTSSFTFIEAF